MPIPFSRVGFATLAGLLLAGGSIIAGSTQGRDNTPAAVGCDGAVEYVEAFQTAVREALSDSEVVLENPASATSAELAEAADGFADAKESVEQIDPPPAGEEFHSTAIAWLGTFSQFLDSFATGGVIAALAYSETIEEVNAEFDATAASFEQACDVDVINNDDVTPQASAQGEASGIRADPFPLGSTVELKDDWTVTILSVTPDATDAVLAENQFNEPPASGHQFFIARISATYTGQDSDQLGGRYRFQAVGQSAVAYSVYDDSCGTIPDELPDPDVFTGGTIEGNICWSIRTDDAASLVMYDDAASDDERIFFSLIPGEGGEIGPPDTTSSTAPPPNPEAVGRIEAINVLDALIAQDLDAAFGRSTARAAQLTTPGQTITVGSDTLYVFVYPSVQEREADSNGLNEESLVLTSVGTPVADGSEPPHVVVYGNIIIVLPGGDDELRAKVDAAIASLPEVIDTTDATPLPGT
jgi:hypothetical protein